jgi:molecular chaperone GrpE (heat shock protein)
MPEREGWNPEHSELNHDEPKMEIEAGSEDPLAQIQELLGRLGSERQSDKDRIAKLEERIQQLESQSQSQPDVSIQVQEDDQSAVHQPESVTIQAEQATEAMESVEASSPEAIIAALQERTELLGHYVEQAPDLERIIGRINALIKGYSELDQADFEIASTRNNYESLAFSAFHAGSSWAETRDVSEAHRILNETVYFAIQLQDELNKEMKEKHGFEELLVKKGSTFDPQMHTLNEAIMDSVPPLSNEHNPPNTIQNVVYKGQRLKGQVVKKAEVVAYQGPKERPKYSRY